MFLKAARTFCVLCVTIPLAACGGLEVTQDFMTKDRDGNVMSESELKRQAKEDGTIFGSGLGGLFDLGDGDKKVIGRSGIAVNSFLWRASLDTIAFMPLSSADPFGGVIITDWYTPPEAQQERYKLSVYILSRQLRADGIRVSAFRQKSIENTWRSSTISKQTALNIENQILTRARQLRIAAQK